MLNKPSGVLTAARDKKQKTVMDLLPPMYAAMGAMPAGRLDKDTEGLLVITSDGQLAHRIISPKHEVGKVYYARLDGELTDEDVAALEAGIHIRDADGEFDARPAQIDRDGRRRGLYPRDRGQIPSGQAHVRGKGKTGCLPQAYGHRRPCA